MERTAVMQQDLVMSERIKAAEAAISTWLRAQYPAFAGKTRVPRPALVAEAVAYALVHPPTRVQLETYLEQFSADRADARHNRGGSFIANDALTANAQALAVVLGQQIAGSDWAAMLRNHHGEANQRAVYYVALRTLADAVSEKGEGT